MSAKYPRWQHSHTVPIIAQNRQSNAQTTTRMARYIIDTQNIHINSIAQNPNLCIYITSLYKSKYSPKPNYVAIQLLHLFTKKYQSTSEQTYALVINSITLCILPFCVHTLQYLLQILLHKKHISVQILQ